MIVQEHINGNVSLRRSQIRMKNEDLSYSVIHTSRKTVSISINRDGSVTVRAPLHVPDYEINQIVLQKKDWIKKKKNQVLDQTQLVHNKYHRDYDEVSTMPFRGKEYELRFIKHNGLKIPIIELQQDYFRVLYGEYDKQKIRNAFRFWYMKRAKEIYMDRIAYYQAIIKEPIGVVRIKEQRSCYGSCSSKRNLNFNWKCILAPKEVLDYIVVHELTHLKEMNHSKKFWDQVAIFFPNYQLCRLWLRENNEFLEI